MVAAPNKRSKRARQLRPVLIGTVMLMALAQFNNCGNYAEPKLAEEASSSFACTTSDCILPVSTNLKLTPHIGTSGSYDVPASLAEFNIGGACNEGGYKANLVRWELWLGGVPVRNSGMQVAAGGPANSRCINGRFLIYVNLAAIPGDGANRTGLASGVGVRSAYDLWIEVYGQEQVNSPLDPAIRYKTRVPLSAI